MFKLTNPLDVSVRAGGVALPNDEKEDFAKLNHSACFGHTVPRDTYFSYSVSNVSSLPGDLSSAVRQARMRCIKSHRAGVAHVLKAVVAILVAGVEDHTANELKVSLKNAYDRLSPVSFFRCCRCSHTFRKRSSQLYICRSYGQLQRESRSHTIKHDVYVNVSICIDAATNDTTL